MLNSEIDYLERKYESVSNELIQLKILEEFCSDVNLERRIKSLTKERIYIENKLTDFWDSHLDREDYN